MKLQDDRAPQYKRDGLPEETMTSGRRDESGHVAALGIRVLALQGFLVSLVLNPALLAHMLPHFFGNHPRRLLFAGVLHILGMATFASAAWCAPHLGRRLPAQLVFNRVPTIGNLLFAFGTLATVLCMQEVFFYSLNATINRPLKVDLARSEASEPYLQQDSLLGFRGIPGAAARRNLCLVDEERPIFSVTYRLDDNGNRVVPQSGGNKDEHLAAFGCSFMFGDGCNDDETFPAQLACLHPSTAVYSYGIPGYSPSQAALLPDIGALDTVQPRAGAAVFLFIPDHLNRIVSGGRRSHGKISLNPAFVMDDLGTPQYRGAFVDFSPGRTKLNDFITAFNAPILFGVQSIFPPDAARYELCAALLALLRDGYQDRFPGNRLYVLLHPVCYEMGHNIEAFTDALDRHDVEWLCPEKLYGDIPYEEYAFRCDGHPTPLAHALLAEWLLAQFPDGFAAGPKASLASELR